MRLTDDRYTRDRARLELALRFIRHEARTRTIRLWTGLTDDRIRKLFHSYACESEQIPARHRGKSPAQAAFFVRSARLQSDTDLAASLLAAHGVLPRAPMHDAARLMPSLARGALLCDAYEAFRLLRPESAIAFEHFIHLAICLARADELRLRGCPLCEAVTVGDALAVRDRPCSACQGESRRPAANGTLPAVAARSPSSLQRSP